MSRRITGLTPSGELHLGNYFGAIKPLADHQIPGQSIAFVSDLHALTLDHDPADVRRRTLEFAIMLLAADILLYGAQEVPVGEDQRQHVELARDIAERFNTAYGPVFTPPRMVNPPVAARIMDLTRPTAKMSKSVSARGVPGGPGGGSLRNHAGHSEAPPSNTGSLRLLDPPNVLRHTVMRAVTDAGDSVEYDPAYRPGLANLLTILAACTGDDPARLAETFDGYRHLKEAVADAVVAVVEPIQRRYTELADDPDTVRKILRDGALRARDIAHQTVTEAKQAIGLLPA